MLLPGMGAAQGSVDLDDTLSMETFYQKYPIDTADKSLGFEESGSFGIYRMEARDLKFGDAYVSSLSYIFRLDQLVLMTFQLSGKKNRGAVYEFLEASYGAGDPGKVTEDNQWVVYWYGDAVTLQYFEDNNRKTTMLLFYSNRFLTLLKNIDTLKKLLLSDP